MVVNIVNGQSQQMAAVFISTPVACSKTIKHLPELENT